MRIGVVFPQTEIGRDPAGIHNDAQAVEAMSYTHILAFDSVVGANPDGPGGWDSPFTYRHAFHEQPIPVWMGGESDAVLRRAARLADGWITLQTFRPGPAAQQTVDRLRCRPRSGQVRDRSM